VWVVLCLKTYQYFRGGNFVLCKGFFYKNCRKIAGTRVDVGLVLFVVVWFIFFLYNALFFFAFKTKAGTFWERTAFRHSLPTLFTDSETGLYFFYWISESITDFFEWNQVRIVGASGCWSSEKSVWVYGVYMVRNKEKIYNEKNVLWTSYFM